MRGSVGAGIAGAAETQKKVGDTLWRITDELRDSMNANDSGD